MYAYPYLQIKYPIANFMIILDLVLTVSRAKTGVVGWWWVDGRTGGNIINKEGIMMD